MANLNWADAALGVVLTALATLLWKMVRLCFQKFYRQFDAYTLKHFAREYEFIAEIDRQGLLLYLVVRRGVSVLGHLLLLAAMPSVYLVAKEIGILLHGWIGPTRLDGIGILWVYSTLGVLLFLTLGSMLFMGFVRPLSRFLMIFSFLRRRYELSSMLR